MKKRNIVLPLILAAAMLGGCNNAVNEAGSVINSGINELGAELGEAGKEIGNAVDELGKAAGDIGSSAGEVIGEIGDAFGSFAGEAANEIGNAVNAAGEAIGNTVGEAAEAVGDFFTGGNHAEQVLFTDGFDTFAYMGDKKGGSGERIVVIRYSKDKGAVPYELIDTKTAMFFADNMHTGRYKCINADENGIVCVPANKETYENEKNTNTGYTVSEYIEFIYEDSDGNVEQFDDAKYNGSTEFDFCGEFGTKSIMFGADGTKTESNDKNFTFAGRPRYSKF